MPIPQPDRTPHATPADEELRRRYEVLRALLKKNSAALRLLADLEADLAHVEPSHRRIERVVHRLGNVSLLLAEELNLLTGDRHRRLYDALEAILASLESVFRKAPAADSQPVCIPLADPRAEDALLVGGKAAGLARLRHVHADMVPPGFVVGTSGYRRFLEANDLLDAISSRLADIDAIADRRLLASRTAAIREIILQAETPPEIREQIESHVSEIGSAGTRWAVRSSARSEDELFSFAGQFETMLGVEPSDLDRAYKTVLAGRFTDRAVLYRVYCGFREVDTPMAVLFMPMIDARAAGVIHTVDPSGGDADRMVLTFVAGTSERLLRGEAEGTTLHLSRDQEPRVLQSDGAGAEGAAPASCVSSDDLAVLGAAVLRAVAHFGYEMDVEWAIDRGGRPWLLQGRRLRVVEGAVGRERDEAHAPPFVERGVTIYPGRAEGPVEHVSPAGSRRLRFRAPVLVADVATPDLSAVLPEAAALLVREGNPAGHAATLIREFAVPTVFQLGDAASLLRGGETVSVDASRRQVFRGSRWEGIRERVLARVTADRARSEPGPLHDLVIALHLTDPAASSFKARSCRSLHDVVRFVHEMSIRSMFSFGDRQNRPWKRSTRKLVSHLPFEIRVIDMDGTVPGRKGKVAPEEIGSVPFQAFWRGASDHRVDWSRRSVPELDWMPTQFVETILGGSSGPRRRGDANFVVVASDYLNLNARMAFHYAMIDAVVGPGKESNHVHFRARGGGADDARRGRRARFLELVLRDSHFVVDRKGDLVTAWLRGYPRTDSEEALAMLGRLMACARQLDMCMVDDASPRRYASEFSAGNFRAFV